MDTLLDQATTGPLYLRRPEIATLMVDALRYGEKQIFKYDLHAYVVMSNHVHLLITPREPLSKITHSLKRFTARKANELLGLTGQPFWQDESYDHLVRNAEGFERIVHYIENNPVRAGLAKNPADFLWSSGAGLQPARDL